MIKQRKSPFGQYLYNTGISYQEFSTVVGMSYFIFSNIPNKQIQYRMFDLLCTRLPFDYMSLRQLCGMHQFEFSEFGSYLAQCRINSGVRLEEVALYIGYVVNDYTCFEIGYDAFDKWELKKFSELVEVDPVVIDSIRPTYPIEPKQRKSSVNLEIMQNMLARLYCRKHSMYELMKLYRVDRKEVLDRLKLLKSLVEYKPFGIKSRVENQKQFFWVEKENV